MAEQEHHYFLNPISYGAIWRGADESVMVNFGYELDRIEQAAIV
jgi:hypothetical protein